MKNYKVKERTGSLKHHAGYHTRPKTLERPKQRPKYFGLRDTLPICVIVSLFSFGCNTFFNQLDVYKNKFLFMKRLLKSLSNYLNKQTNHSCHLYLNLLTIIYYFSSFYTINRCRFSAVRIPGEYLAIND